jgi:hypothetical protein
VRRLIVVLALVVGLAVPVVAYAADLNPNQEGQFSCPYGGTWHFVNVQTGGNYGGTSDLTALFSGGASATTAPNGAGVLKNTTHYWLSAAGTLLSASTSNDGFIVLSDYECQAKKEK